MAEALANQVLEKIDQLAELYHRLMIVVAPAGAGKTDAIREVQQRTGFPLININLELSRHMLDLTDRQRALQLPRILGEIIDEAEGHVILLDNIEILFDVSLKQDALRLLKGLSRNKTIIVSWNGSVENDYVTYAVPSHAEYKRYPAKDVMIVTPEGAK